MLVIGINEKNKVFFEPLMPEEQYCHLDGSSVFALGVLAGEEENEAAGVLVFSVDEGSNGEEDLIAANILWLYVHPQYRRQKAADQMMEKFFEVMDNSRIEYILCDVPMPEEYNLLCAYLEAWGFEFGLINRYELNVELGSLLEKSVFNRKIKTQVIPLKEASQAVFGSFLKRVLDLPGVFQELPYNLTDYEGDVSCVSMQGKTIEGALLVQTVGNNMLELLLLRAVSNQQTVMADLMRYAVRAAGQKYPPETQIHIVCRTGAAGVLIEGLFPDAQPLLVRRGCYYNGADQENDNVDEGMN